MSETTKIMKMKQAKFNHVFCTSPNLEFKNN